MNKKISLLLVLVLLLQQLSCKQSKGGNKADFGIKSSEPQMVFTPDQYTANSLTYLNNQKKDLQIVLPNAINDALLIYKDLLIQAEKSKIYSTSLTEQEKYIKDIQSKAFDSLVAKDIDVNLSYSQLLSNLENLNLQYSKKYNIPIDSFKSFYEMDKILLSEEVLLKIHELINEDKLRTEKLAKDERNDKIANGAVLLISILPMGGSLAKIPSFSKSAIDQIYKGVSLATRNKSLSADASNIAKITYNFAKNSGNSKLSHAARKQVIKTLSNNAKRIEKSAVLASGAKRATITHTVMGAKNLNDIQDSQNNIPKHSRDFFKDIENKLEGRIGDFSDGMLAVYLQNVREVIKYNQNLINKKTVKY